MSRTTRLPRPTKPTITPDAVKESSHPGKTLLITGEVNSFSYALPRNWPANRCVRLQVENAVLRGQIVVKQQHVRDTVSIADCGLFGTTRINTKMISFYRSWVAENFFIDGAMKHLGNPVGGVHWNATATFSGVEFDKKCRITGMEVVTLVDIDCHGLMEIEECDVVVLHHCEVRELRLVRCGVVRGVENHIQDFNVTGCPIVDLGRISD